MTRLASSYDVDVVFPCLDEAAALPWVLSRLPDHYRAIVADNGSTDRSADVARAHGALVVDAPVRGFGAACQAGLAAATAPVVAFLDADATLDPADLPRLVAALQDPRDPADLVLARRRPVSRAAWPVGGRIGNRAVTLALRRRTGVRLGDLGPMRVARTEALRTLGVCDGRFGYPLEMVVKAAAAGWRITELPMPYYERTGRSKVTGTLTGLVRTARDMRRVLAS